MLKEFSIFERVRFVGILYNKFMENKVTIDTDTFKLVATLEEGKLTISLWDLEDVVPYARQYTDKDIGGQINRKAELADLFDVLTESLSHPDSQEYQEYTYNQMHTINDIQYYKLQKGGILSIYTPWVDIKNQKTIYIESKLHLDVDGSVKKEEMEVEIKKRNKLKQNKNQNKDSKSIIDAKEEIEKMRNQLSQMRKQQKQLNQKILQKIDELASIFNQSKQKILQTDIQKQRNTTLSLSPDPKNLNQPTTKSQNKNKKQFNIPYITSTIQQQNLSNFLIVGNMIEYIGNQNNYTQLIFNAFIPYDSVYVFKIRSVRNVFGINLMVGVVDYEKQKAAKMSYNSKNAIYYRSYQGKGYQYSTKHQTKELGVGFKEGEILEVAVSRSEKKVTWSVEGKVRATIYDDILGEKSRIFLPCVEVCYKNDIFQIVQF